MRTLNNVLSDLAHAIVHGHETPPDAQAVYPNYRVTTAMTVYRNNYRGNLHDTLACVYPVTEQLVGKDFFRMMTRQFIGQHFSCSGNLHHYGAEMAAFIAGFTPAQGLAYLPDVVALEWACHCAYFAPDAATLDINKLSRIPPGHYPDLILLIHPACHVVRSRYPITAIWHAHQPNAPGEFHIDLDSGPCIALASRMNDVIHVSELAEADAAWLLSIQAGTPLGTATDATQKQYPDFDLQAALINLASKNVLTDFNLGAAP